MPAVQRRTLQAAPLPRWLRPKLTRSQQRDTAIIVLQKLADVQAGTADAETLWDMARDAFTWSRAAELLGAGHVEMLGHLELVTRMIEHYGRTGRVEFSCAAQDQAARLAAAYMEDLAALVDRDTAIAAAAWSEAMVDSLMQHDSHTRRAAA